MTDSDPTDFVPVPLAARHDGWTAARQRRFIATLAETCCVAEACRAAGVTPRSAYRLRAHPKGKLFVQAWDAALQVASVRLASIAMDRAINGSVREYWKNGECVGEVRAPSDKLLMFLLTRLDTRRFGSFAGISVMADDPVDVARHRVPRLIDRLHDVPCGLDPDDADMNARALPATGASHD